MGKKSSNSSKKRKAEEGSRDQHGNGKQTKMGQDNNCHTRSRSQSLGRENQFTEVVNETLNVVDQNKKKNKGTSREVARITFEENDETVNM